MTLIETLAQQNKQPFIKKVQFLPSKEIYQFYNLHRLGDADLVFYEFDFNGNLNKIPDILRKGILRCALNKNEEILYFFVGKIYPETMLSDYFIDNFRLAYQDLLQIQQYFLSNKNYDINEVYIFFKKIDVKKILKETVNYNEKLLKENKNDERIYV